jgi:hypothetical protein
MFDDYYSTGSGQGHYVAIVGFYDAGLLGQYLIIQDTNVTVVTYPMSWLYLQAHKQTYFVYLDGVGMADSSHPCWPDPSLAPDPDEYCK